MENKILEKYAKEGFLLEKELFDIISKLDNDKILEILEILTKITNKKVITKKLYEKNLKKFKNIVFENKKTLKILSNNEFNPKKITVSDFISYFRSRFEELKDILIQKDFNNLISIRRLGFNSGIYNIIAMVSNIKTTKSKNLLIEIEDLTGKSNVLVNRENKELFNKAKGLMLDDIVVFCVSGSSKMLFANDFIFPDAKLDKEKFGNEDSFVAFSGDFHVGSRMFLEKNVLKFIDWLNGEVGDDRQRTIAKKVKYLFLTGNNIEGVGFYNGQEKILNIKSCRAQYRKLEKILGKIRKDISIIICPGQNDSVWLGEPQAAIGKKWASDLFNMENLFLVSNPCEIEIDSGFRVLMYHGASINGFVNNIPKLREKKVIDIVKEILKRRHLAPSYGIMDYIPKRDKDNLVIKNIPDIIVMGNSCCAEIESWNNILMVSTSCWQNSIPFGGKSNCKPDPCKVPLFNLKNREIKIIDFSDNIIRWEEDDNLVCKLEDNKNE